MAVGVAEIQAGAAVALDDAALDRDAVLVEVAEPVVEAGEGDGEAEVLVAAGVVRGDDAARGVAGVDRAADAEQEEDALAGDAEADHAVLLEVDREAEDEDVE